MPLSIKANLRVTGHCNQGGRKYMEDMFSVAYQQTPDDRDLEYAFFGIFDGHGGGEAAKFAKDHLMDLIVKQKNFWSEKDEDVLRAIRDGYVNTHYAMWREIDKWPRTASGLPSTAGTTASIAFIRKGKIYIGHVGDSGIVLGYQDDDGDPQWKAKALTRDHKPESGPEMTRIQESGGKVISKSGVPRVVWNRPRIGHKGPVRRSTHIDEIPFLAVARSLGDLWSYNSELDTFVVSPEPDVKVIEVDVKTHRCLIFGTDGLWNMLSPQAAISIVQAAEKHNEKHFIASQQTGTMLPSEHQIWINPSKSLVDRALERWSTTRLRADNTSVVTLMIDPPGPSRQEFLLNRSRKEAVSKKVYANVSSNCASHSNNLKLPRSLSPPPIYNHVPCLAERSINMNKTFPPQASTANICNRQLLKPHSSNYSINNGKQRCTSSVPSATITPGLNKLVQENTTTLNSKMGNAPLANNNKKLLFTVIEQARDINTSLSIFDKHNNTNNNIINDKNNTKNVKNIQVAEISSSNLNLDTNGNDKSAVAEDEHLPRSYTNLSNEKIDENDKFSSKTMLKELPRTSEFFKEPTSVFVNTPEDDFDDLHQLERQNAFTNLSLSDFKPLTATMPKSALNSVTNSSNEIIHIEAEKNIANNCREFPRKRQQKDVSFNIINFNNLSSVETMESTRVIRRREIPLRPGITTRTRQIIHTNRPTPMATKRTASIKRRHSSTLDQLAMNDNSVCNLVVRQSHQSVEPCLKRRTRSEDHKCPRRNENNPINQTKQPSQQQHTRLRWINSCSNIKNRNMAMKSDNVKIRVENLSPMTSTTTSSSSYQRRNLEKKATPIKSTIRRQSMNCSGINNSANTSSGFNGESGCSNRFAQLKNNFSLNDWDQNKSNRRKSTGREDRLKLNCMVVSSSNSGSNHNNNNSSSNSNKYSNSSPPVLHQRWLRSDTIAATPIKTLRSRNVDIAGHTIPPHLAHQYGIVKQQNRTNINNTKFGKVASNSSSKIMSKSSITLTPNTKLIKAPASSINYHGTNTTASALSNVTVSSSSSIISKRVKSSSYNSSARSRLGTRSRLKRLSK